VAAVATAAAVAVAVVAVATASVIKRCRLGMHGIHHRNPCHSLTLAVSIG
jgi:hypothetical protein